MVQLLGLGPQELLVILGIVILLFGAQKIPQLARSLGKGLGEFRKAQREVKDELASDPIVAAAAVCPSCQGQNAAGSLFCSLCGQRLSVQAPVCRACQRPLRPGDRFCSGCGQEQ